MGRGEQLFEVTMAIYLIKKTGNWKAEIWHNQKRYASKTFSKKALAEKFERDTLLELEKQQISGTQAKDYTYNEIFDLSS